MPTPEQEKEGQGSIKLSASRIRTSVSQFVTQELQGAFPKNWVYMRGNYNRVFVVAEGYGDQCDGFFEKGYLVTLDADGQFRAGDVAQNVGDYTHSWEFYDAKLTKASDMEVIRYAPLLLTSLFGLIENELKEESDPQKRERWSNVLQRREGEIFAVLIESGSALIAAGEDPEIPSSGAQDYGSLAMAGLEEMIKKMKWGCTQ